MWLEVSITSHNWHGSELISIPLGLQARISILCLFFDIFGFFGGRFDFFGIWWNLNEILKELSDQLKIANLTQLCANTQPRRNLRFQILAFCWTGLIPYFRLLETTNAVFFTEVAVFSSKVIKRCVFSHFW